MFGQKRLAKRSIVGSRISGLWQDGRYYPGLIQDVSLMPNGKHIYTVLFDDGFTKNLNSSQIIGQCYKQPSNFQLKFDQKVYLTFNGREIFGNVIKHHKDNDVVLVRIKDSDGQQHELERGIDEVRLCESRKSSRLDGHRDTDYSKMADLNIHGSTHGHSHGHNVTEGRKRTVSHVIDVPMPKQSRSHSNHGNTAFDDEMEMDEQMAAMVLTSLSCSPASPRHLSHDYTKGSPDSFLSTSVKSGSPSPTSHRLHVPLSSSAPPEFVFSPSSYDEGIDMNLVLVSEDETNSSPKRKKSSTKTVYRCTWRGCHQMCHTCHDIEHHVRQAHLGLQKHRYVDPDLSDHEEEFYYTEEEINIDSMTQNFAQLYTSSPPSENEKQLQKQSTDHDYQRKKPKFHIPEDAFITSEPPSGILESVPVIQSTGTGPINIPRRPGIWNTQSQSSYDPNVQQVNDAFPSVTNKSTATSAPSTGGGQGQGLSFHDFWQQSPTATSPKSPSFSGSAKQCPGPGTLLHRKPRSEVKKCRKVYGMENRDLWCTQCKWKKACSRFIE